MYDQQIRMHYAGTVSIVTEPMVQLAQQLAALAPGDLSRAFFVSGGSEAVESAVKIAKQSRSAAARSLTLQEHLPLERLSRRDGRGDGADQSPVGGEHAGTR